MSKQIQDRTLSGERNRLSPIDWWPARLLLIAISLAAISIVPGGAAQPAPQQPAATTAASRNAALIAATQEVLKETSEVRQLAILRPVQSSTQSRAEIERAVMKNLD
jgi:hypothetical protein